VTPLLAAEGVAIHPLNLAEAVDRVVRASDGGADPDDVESDIVILGIERTDVSADVLVAAGRLRATAYHRVRCPISLADCVAAAHALAHRVALATADPHLADIVRRRGGDVVALPDSTGRRPGEGAS
jgi:predicted nucleic acid-binding protein